MSAQDDPNLPKAGDLLAGKYRIERVLGKGGMGIVYAAHHEILAQRVAVKLLLSEIAANAEVVARFLNEARSAARIQSDHIARVMDVGTVPNAAKPDGAPMPYIVMEYLEGVDLAQLLESGGPLPLTNAVDHLLQALEALAQAHLIGIVHRDLKPANLFLVKRNDGNPQVKVLDFGISKVTNPFAGAAKTSTSSMLGTPYYMSPEQLRNAKDVDARSDIWSLGVLLHELLAGTPPFVGETLGELLMAIVEREPASLHAMRPDVPAAFDPVVLRCLRRKREERYADVGELADALAPFASARGVMSAQRVLAAMQHDSTKVMVSPARSSSPEFVARSPALMPISSPALTDLSVPTPSPARRPAATAGSWTETHGGASAGGGGRGVVLLAVAALIGVVVLGAGAFGVHRLASKPVAPESVTTASSGAFAANTPPVLSPASSSAAPSVPEPASSISFLPLVQPSAPAAQPSPPTATPVAVRQAPALIPSAKASAAPITRSAASAPANCTPPFTIDTRGSKVFKKECL